MVHLLQTLCEELENCAPTSLMTKSRGHGITIGETESSIFVELPVPGCNKEDIQITFEKGQLLVKAEPPADKGDVTFLMKANRHVAFQVAIPRRIDEQSVPEAQYKDGILKVSFQKARAERSCKIEIKTT